MGTFDLEANQSKTPGKAKGKTNRGDLAGHAETKGSRTTAEFSSPAESTAKSPTSWSAGQKKEIVTMQRGPVDAVIETPGRYRRSPMSGSARSTIALLFDTAVGAANYAARVQHGELAMVTTVWRQRQMNIKMPFLSRF